MYKRCFGQIKQILAVMTVYNSGSQPHPWSTPQHCTFCSSPLSDKECGWEPLVYNYETYICLNKGAIPSATFFLFPILSLILSLVLFSLWFQFAVNSATLQRISGLENGYILKRSASCSIHTRGILLMLAQRSIFSASVLHPFKGKTFPLGITFYTIVFFFSLGLFIVHEPIWCLMECILRVNLLRPIPRNSWCFGHELEQQTWQTHLSKTGWLLHKT